MTGRAAPIHIRVNRPGGWYQTPQGQVHFRYDREHWAKPLAPVHQSGEIVMDDIKAAAAKHHEDAAHRHETAAKMHHEAAKHSGSGNFEKAERLATSAAEVDAAANRHVVEALELYRHHAQEVANRKTEAAAEEAARVAKREGKAAADN